MKTFVKILGPPLNKALKELEKIAIKMPEVCMMSSPIALSLPIELAKDINAYTGYEKRSSNLDPRLPEFAWRYFNSSDVLISRERCENIISNSGIDLGEYDFYFEWNNKPSSEDLDKLISYIDSAIKPLGCLYTLETK